VQLQEDGYLLFVSLQLRIHLAWYKDYSTRWVSFTWPTRPFSAKPDSKSLQIQETDCLWANLTLRPLAKGDRRKYKLTMWVFCRGSWIVSSLSSGFSRHGTFECDEFVCIHGLHMPGPNIARNTISLFGSGMIVLWPWWCREGGMWKSFPPRRVRAPRW